MLTSSLDPYFYIPSSAFASNVLEKVSKDGKPYWIAKLKTSNKTTNRVIGFSEPKSPLNDLIRIEVTALDKWFVEDVQILGPHPKDPYKRIECLPSSREIRVELDGKVNYNMPICLKQ